MCVSNFSQKIPDLSNKLDRKKYVFLWALWGSIRNIVDKSGKADIHYKSKELEENQLTKCPHASKS